MSDMSVKEAYRVLQAACGIEVGDKVRVLRGFKQGEMGTDGMDSHSSDLVGDTGVVTSKCFSWLHLSMDKHLANKSEMHYPFFCLELIEKAKPGLPPIKVGNYEVKFLDGEIEVECVTVTKETIKEILERLEG